MLSFHMFAIHQLRRSTSLIPAAARPIRFRHKAKSSSQQPLWNLHLQTVTPVTPLESAPTKTAGWYWSLRPKSLKKNFNFLLFRRVPLLPNKILALSFHALTNCNFSNSFVLAFMQNAGGVGGYNNAIPKEKLKVAQYLFWNARLARVQGGRMA